MNTELPSTYFLSPEQRQFYEENGYLVIKGFIDFASLYTYKQRFSQITSRNVDRGSMRIVKEKKLISQGLTGEDVINKISEIHYDEVFMSYTEHPRLIHVISQFIGDDMRVMNSMVINKPPGSVSHPPHQDLFYFPFRPAEKIIAAWTAVDDATIENGCLYIVPKSHKRNIMYKHGNIEDATNVLYHGILDQAVASEPRFYLEMSPGDTVFFHPLVVHGSGPNTTQRYRKSMTAHYAAADVHYIDVRGSIQEDLAKETEELVKKYGLHMSYAELWQLKSKEVTRVKSKL
ncbi:unnamed protein product, partial [Brenthis ino]